MNKRGQSALDYISTYGWALLTISAVLGALYLFMDFKQPDNYISDTCSFGIGDSFYCVDAVITSSTRIVNMSLRNTLGTELNVTQVICSYKDFRNVTVNNVNNIQPGDLFNVYCDMKDNPINFNKKAKVDVTLIYYKKGSTYPFSVDGAITSNPFG